MPRGRRPRGDGRRSVRVYVAVNELEEHLINRELTTDERREALKRAVYLKAQARIDNEQLPIDSPLNP